MNSQTKKQNNRRPSQRHTKTGNQKRFPVFLRSFLAFSKIASIAPCKGGLERNLLSRLANPQAVRGGRAKRNLSCLFPRAMSQVPCLHEHKVSKLAWRMPRVCHLFFLQSEIFENVKIQIGKAANGIEEEQKHSTEHKG